MYKLVIADDHSIVREGIKQLLASLDGYDVLAEATNGLEAISLVKQHKPDLLILDVSMPYANALEVYLEVQRWSPATRTIVFTGVSTAGLLSSLINEGVNGLILKSSVNDELQRAIQAVMAGERYIQAEAAALIDSSSGAAILTRREQQILQLICSGHSNPQIAEALTISVKTVDNHRSSLMKKLQVHSVAELMARALAEGLLDTSIGGS